jgi:hypothetical protein
MASFQGLSWQGYVLVQMGFITIGAFFFFFLYKIVQSPLKKCRRLIKYSVTNSIFPALFKRHSVLWLLGLRGVSWGVVATGVLQYPRVLFAPRIVAAGLRGREEAGRELCPRPSKREEISFLILAWLDWYIFSPYIERFTYSQARLTYL